MNSPVKSNRQATRCNPERLHPAATLAFVVTALAVWLTPSTKVMSEKLTKPNIVLMMADDLGWGDTGFNGNEIIQTPHLDEMARSGMTFMRFYAAAPVCSPTRGSCITGRHPFRYGIYFANTGHIKPPEITLPELLKKHGYTTGHFGKWHLGTLTSTVEDANRGGPRGAKHLAPPAKHGFDVNFSTESKVPTWDPMLRPKGVKGKTWWAPAEDAAAATHHGTRYWSSGQEVKENLRGDDSRVIMDRVIPFVQNAVKERQPFFAVVWFHAPHLPVVAGPEFTQLYEKYEGHAKHYYGCITALDKQVGRLRSELKALGASDNTMLCFCSDNGPEGNEKSPGSSGGLRGRKRSLFEGGVRVPAVIEWPARVKAGSKTDVPAVTSDYLPTILEVLGVSTDLNRPIDGVSLLPWLGGSQAPRGRSIGFQSNNMAAWSGDRYKLIGQVGAAKKRKGAAAKTGWMLFDLQQDPREKKDIASEHPDMVKRMAAELQAWRKSCQHSDSGGDY